MNGSAHSWPYSETVFLAWVFSSLRRGTEMIRKWSLVVTLLPAALVCAGDAFAQVPNRWWVVQRGEQVISIDTLRIGVVGNGVFRVWERRDHRRPQKSFITKRQRYDYEKLQLDYDCRNLRYRLLGFIEYRKSGEVVGSDFRHPQKEWVSSVPGTIDEERLLIVCGFINRKWRSR